MGRWWTTLEKRCLPKYAWTSDRLTLLRERVLFTLCLVAAVIGPVALIPSLFLALAEGRWGVFILDVVVYCLAVAVLLARRLPLGLRTGIVCLTLFFLGLGLLFMLGPYGAGYIWLFGTSVLAGALIGIGAAIWSLVLSFLALLAVAIQLVWMPPVWALKIDNVLEKWVVTGLNFLLLSALVSIVTSLMLSHLKKSLSSEREVSASLRRSEARFRTLAENAPDIIFTTDAEGILDYVNPALTSVLGRSPAEVIGRPFWELAPPGEDGPFQEAFGRIVPAGETVDGLEVVLTHQNGGKLDVNVSAGPRFEETGQLAGVVGLLKDVTQQRTLARQLQQSQKMEAVGRLAGGVAHDFNNLLTIITGYTGLVMEELSPGDPLYEDLKEINDAGLRAAELTRQLLIFSRKQVIQPRILRLNSLVANIQKMLGRLIGEDIELIVVPDPTLGLIRADPGQIEQVILNLAVNARDAMPSGGKLIIGTSNVEITEAIAGSETTISPGRYVVFTVRDTGIGMDGWTKSQIFEPFFTTKETGKGTGLGLSTVYGIVQQSGGHIEVFSDPGRGSTFRLYLPRVDGIGAEEEEAPPAEGELRGTETILLVEDEVGLRKFASRVLNDWGYTVLEAGGGAEALQIANEHNGPLDLLLTDVIMPRMNGAEVADRIGELRPGIRVLFMSGYTDEAIFQQGVLADGVNLITKPFSPGELCRQLRRVLDQGR